MKEPDKVPVNEPVPDPLKTDETLEYDAVVETDAVPNTLPV